MSRILFTIYLSFHTSLCFSQDLITLERLSSSPTDRELSGAGAHSEAAQGIALSEDSVYYTNASHIWKMDKNMAETTVSVSVNAINVDHATCPKFGGIEVFQKEVFVAVIECNDAAANRKKAWIAVFDLDLSFKRHAILPDLGNRFAYAAVNEMEPDLFYGPCCPPTYKSLYGYPIDFENYESLAPVKKIHFDKHPVDVLNTFWTQGGEFTQNGLFLRVVDEADDEDSLHSGIWIYELENSSNHNINANRVGLENIKYDSRGHFGRVEELEDLHFGSIPESIFDSDVHIVMLSNELGEDDVTIMHFKSKDLDGDGILDLKDNCFRIINGKQVDLDSDGFGFECDQDEAALLYSVLWI